jgi:transposase-like protein
MALSDLPPADTRRWVASRKAAVVAAVEQRLLSVEDACDRYGLTREELDSWRAALGEHGVGALRTTRLQLYRSG